MNVTPKFYQAKSIHINGWIIRYNTLWLTWQCSYDGEIYGEFSTLTDAKKYCKYSRP